MKKILIPTDFSVCANNAGNLAIEIAKRIGAEIHFLHFTSIPVDWINLTPSNGKMYPDVDQRIKQCQDRLNELASEARKQSVQAFTYIGYNESYHNIIDHVDKLAIDLVIMGSHGASGLKELFLGSNAQKVIRLSDVPVLVTKETNRTLNTQKMVIVSDFDFAKSKEDLGTFERLAKLAELLDLKIHLLFVNTPGFFIPSKTIEDRIKMLENASSTSIESMTTINAFNLESGLEEYLDGDQNAVIGMMTHGTRGINRLFQTSLVEDVANHIENPLLSAHLS